MKKITLMTHFLVLTTCVNLTSTSCHQQHSKPTSISINLKETTTYEGDEIHLQASIFPEDAKQNVNWKSSDESIATVENGVVCGKKPGEVYISASPVGYDEIVDVCKVTVKQTTYSVEGGGTNLNGTSGFIGSDNNRWKLLRNGKEQTVSNYSIDSTNPHISIENGIISWDKDISIGTYQFKAILDGVSSQEITLTIDAFDWDNRDAYINENGRIHWISSLTSSKLCSAGGEDITTDDNVTFKRELFNLPIIFNPTLNKINNFFCMVVMHLINR